MGIVMEVHTERGTLDVRMEDTEAVFSDVQYANPYTSKNGVSALSVVPCVGDRFLLGFSPSTGEPVLLASLAYPRVNTREVNSPDSAESSPRNNFLGDRPALPEGTINAQTDKDCWARVLPGGQIEIQVDEFCFQHLSRDGRTIRTLCENLLSEGFWGSSDFWTLREDARDGQDRTPAGYSLHQKSYVQDAPHVFLDVGAVLDDEELPLPGFPTLDQRAFGKGVCFRFMVLGQDKANNQQANGLKPDPRTATLLVRFDQAGNGYMKFAGQLTQHARALTSFVEERDVLQAGELRRRTTSGGIGFEAAEAFEVSARRGIRLSTAGNLTLRGAKVVFETDSEERIFRGGWSARMRGNWTVRAGGHGSLSASGSLSLRAGGSRADFVGGRYSMRVSGADTLENAGRDVIAHKTLVDRGKLAMRVKQGSVEISVGEAAAPLASIRIHADPRDPLRAGRLEIITAAGAKLSLDSTGAFRLGGEAGQIQGDAAGNIQIGPVAGAPAYVLTSETRCYVTGLPFVGNPHLTATRVLPPLPSPVAPPVVGVVPPASPVPLPDDVEFVS